MQTEKWHIILELIWEQDLLEWLLQMKIRILIPTIL